MNENYAVTADDGFGAVGTVPVVTFVSEPGLVISKIGPAAALAGASPSAGGGWKLFHSCGSSSSRVARPRDG